MTDEQLRQLDAEWTALPELELDRNALRDKSNKTLLLLAMADAGSEGKPLAKHLVEATTLVPQLITLLQVSRSVSNTVVNQKAEVIAENEALRQVISDAVAALGNGSTCSAKASVEFMKDVPDEVRVVVERLKSEQLSTMQRLTARIRELEQAAAAVHEADPPTPYPTPKLDVPAERSHYYILHGDSMDWVRQQVERMLIQGWKTAGGIHVTNHDALLKAEPVRHFYQAVER